MWLSGQLASMIYWDKFIRCCLVWLALCWVCTCISLLLFALSNKTASLCAELETRVELARSAVCPLRQMLDLAINNMQEAYRPCTPSALRQPFRPLQRVQHNFNCDLRQMQQRTRRTWCYRAQHSNIQQQAELQGVRHKIWPKIGVISALLVNPTASRADELTTAAGDAAQAAANAASDMPPTVTFGGSFGQYDPIIAFFFYAVIATLTVLTLGVAYISIRSWQNSTDEAKERAAFSRSTQDRESGQLSLKAKARRQPPKSKAGKGESKGFGS